MCRLRTLSKGPLLSEIGAAADVSAGVAAIEVVVIAESALVGAALAGATSREMTFATKNLTRRIASLVTRSEILGRDFNKVALNSFARHTLTYGVRKKEDMNMTKQKAKVREGDEQAQVLPSEAQEEAVGYSSGESRSIKTVHPKKHGLMSNSRCALTDWI